MTTLVSRFGWDVHRLAGRSLVVEVLPQLGGSILQVFAKDREGIEVPLLWSTPWGLRPFGATALPGDDEAALMDVYPGGWQTAFPNAGSAVAVHGTIWGMHGEVWRTPLTVDDVDDTSMMMSARLVRAPIQFERRVAIVGDQVEVSDLMTNEGCDELDTMWLSHPTFGPSMLGPGATLMTSARSVVVDADLIGAGYDLQPGAVGDWPFVPSIAGGQIDLRQIPKARSGKSRMAYLTSFPDDDAWVALDQPTLGFRVLLTWDGSTAPYMWYWLEAGGGREFPWFGAVHVLGLEPATSMPVAGLDAARRGGMTVPLGGGTRQTHTVRLRVEGLP